MIRCGSYKDRPAQADNLHIDIWVDGKNYIWDTGSYKYNTSDELIHYFMGSEGHNTIRIAGKDQMLKGSRFIWYNWIKEAEATLEKDNNKFTFYGKFMGFKELGKDIYHIRKVEKLENELVWEIVDEIKNAEGKEVQVFWHLNPTGAKEVEIVCKDKDGLVIQPLKEMKWVSNYYGIKEDSLRLTFRTFSDKIITTIKITTK